MHLTHLATALLPLLAAAEVAHFRYGIVTAAPDLRRQIETCDAGQSACADGSGCCSIGEICTVESGVPLCAGRCLIGAVTCTYNGVTACCNNLGESCDVASPGFCTPTGGLGSGPAGSPATPTPSFSIQTNTDLGTQSSDFFPSGGSGAAGSSSSFPPGAGAPTRTHSSASFTSSSTSFGAGPTPTRVVPSGASGGSAGLGAVLLAGAGIVVALLLA